MRGRWSNRGCPSSIAARRASLELRALADPEPSPSAGDLVDLLARSSRALVTVGTDGLTVSADGRHAHLDLARGRWQVDAVLTHHRAIVIAARATHSARCPPQPPTAVKSPTT